MTDLDREKAAASVLALLGSYQLPEPGDFFKRLILAAVHADSSNLAAIGLGFPNIMRAITLYKFTAGGVEVLEMEAGVRERTADRRTIGISSTETTNYYNEFELGYLEGIAGITLDECGGDLDAFIEHVLDAQGPERDRLQVRLERHGDVQGQTWTAKIVDPADQL